MRSEQPLQRLEEVLDQIDALDATRRELIEERNGWLRKAIKEGWAKRALSEMYKGRGGLSRSNIYNILDSD